MEPLRLRNEIVVPQGELQERFARAGGPGGQGVNTADSKVQLSFDIGRSPSLDDRSRARLLSQLEKQLNDGVLTIEASEHRSQWQNRAAARTRLIETLNQGLEPPPPPRQPTRPTYGSRIRNKAAKQLNSDRKALRKPPDQGRDH